MREVCLGSAQRLVAWQQEVTGISVFNADDFAHLAEIWNAFEQNYLHGGLLNNGVGVDLIQGEGISAAGKRERKLNQTSAMPSKAKPKMGQPGKSTKTL